MPIFNTIGIIGRIKTAGVFDSLKMLIAHLKSRAQEFILETETAAALPQHNYNCVAREKLVAMCDLIIVVGGDGSLLQASHAVTAGNVPVLGINRGRLGFLTDILPSEIEKISSILDGNYTIEQRFIITATVMHHGNLHGQGQALNEIALIPASTPHMHEFEIYIDQSFVCSQDSDGVIIATPTGSTAYALSGGGPILHPALDALVIVPMFPHTLSLRPLVVGGNSKIEIIIANTNITTPRIACDGQNFLDTPAGSTIIIQKSQQNLQLLHPLDYDYYKSLRSKLHWGRKLNHSIEKS